MATIKLHACPRCTNLTTDETVEGLCSECKVDRAVQSSTAYREMVDEFKKIYGFRVDKDVGFHQFRDLGQFFGLIQIMIDSRIDKRIDELKALKGDPELTEDDKLFWGMDEIHRGEIK